MDDSRQKGYLPADSKQLLKEGTGQALEPKNERVREREYEVIGIGKFIIVNQRVVCLWSNPSTPSEAHRVRPSNFRTVVVHPLKLKFLYSQVSFRSSFSRHERLTTGENHRLLVNRVVE